MCEHCCFKEETVTCRNMGPTHTGSSMVRVASAFYSAAANIILLRIRLTLHYKKENKPQLSGHTQKSTWNES